MARDILFDPPNASILIASGRYDGGVLNQGGIWRSTDSGATWTKPATSNPPGGFGEASTWGIANLAEMPRFTNSAGFAYFSGFDPAGGVMVEAVLPATDPFGNALTACPNSPTTIMVPADRFGAFRNKFVQFGARRVP